MTSCSDELKPFLTAFNLERFGVGRHTIKNERGWRVHDIKVQSLWLATISPSFDRKAYLMIVHTDAQTQALFCFRGINSLPNIQSEPVECLGLDDKVCQSLKHIDLCPRSGHLVLDGIGYSLRICTAAIAADLSFSSPKIDSLCGVERAMFEVAESIARITERQDIANYLNTWRKYLH